MHTKELHRGKMQLMHQSTNQAPSFSYSFDGILIVFLITEGLFINFFFKAAANSKELPSVELELGDLTKMNSYFDKT